MNEDGRGFLALGLTVTGGLVLAAGLAMVNLPMWAVVLVLVAGFVLNIGLVTYEFFNPPGRRRHHRR